MDNKTITKFSVPVAIIVAGALIAGAVVYRNANPAPANPGDLTVKTEAVRAVDESDHVRGNINAPVKIIEYSDLECPYCKLFHKTMLEIYDQYGKTGQVAWVYRHFPLEMHPQAIPEAIASECVAKLGGNDSFWQYVDKIFEVTPSNNALDLALLPQMAKDVGLDVNAFNKCLTDPSIKKIVETDLAEAIAAGAGGTPFPIIITAKGKRIALEGAAPLETMQQTITDALKK